MHGQALPVPFGFRERSRARYPRAARRRPMPTNREILEAYSNALPDNLDALDALRHPDFVEEWPQSGETIRSGANMRSIQEHYPGTPSQGSTLRVVGSEDRWVVSP